MTNQAIFPFMVDRTAYTKVPADRYINWKKRNAETGSARPPPVTLGPVLNLFQYYFRDSDA